MAEQMAILPPISLAPFTATDLAAVGASQQIAGQTLPPDFMHLAKSPMVDALSKQLVTHGEPCRPGLEKIYEDNRHRKLGHIWQKQHPVIAAVKSGISRTKK